MSLRFRNKKLVIVLYFIFLDLSKVHSLYSEKTTCMVT